METIELFQRLGLALAIGLLIGIERGWQERKGERGSRTAGIRTYALIGLFGGVWGALAPFTGEWALGLAAAAFAAAFAAYQWREQVAKDDFSFTSAIVGMLAFALGALAVMGDMAAAAAGAVAATALLAARADLHAFLRKLTWPELRSAIVLLTMTVVLLPILPDRNVDPWDALNPYQLWLLTVLIGAMSFAGYVAVRVAGEKQGLLYGGLAGGLVSSTLVTLTYSRLAKKQKPEQQRNLATGIAAAWTMSLLRMTALAAIVTPAIVQPLAVPVAAAAAVLLATVYFQHRQTPANGARLDLGNPLNPLMVLRYGALLAFIVFAAKLLTDQFGQAGLLGLAAVSGVADVDPITLSAARMAGGAVSLEQAALAILIAGAANLLLRIGLAVGIGGPRLGTGLALAGAGALIAGAAGYMFASGMV
ncbi:MAG: MgtC/SapB family protein [Alphaproteobacteria bacterium]